MQDVIRREILIAAPSKKIYAALSQPEQVVRWFPETLEGTYAVGEQPIFGFGEHGRSQIWVVAAEPHHYFAYRWVTGANHFLGDVSQVKSTLVEFRIEETGEAQCKETLTESGFAGLPADVIESSFQQNSRGWDYMLGRLQKLMGA